MDRKMKSLFLFISHRCKELTLLAAPICCIFASSCSAPGTAENNDSADSVLMRQWSAEVAEIEAVPVARLETPETQNPQPEQPADSLETGADSTLAESDAPPAAIQTGPNQLPESPYTKRYKSINEAPYHEIFNDSNKYQYYHAERLGIQPITELGLAFYTRKPLVRIKDCREYGLDSLTHSVPFLVPQAALLLKDIGSRFSEKAKKRTGGDYKIKVTSVLRTEQSVKKLKRVNRNATTFSTHQFGTTFDITYTRYINRRTGADEDIRGLKEALAETLLELRNEGRCQIKYEKKSPCFHITVTK